MLKFIRVQGSKVAAGLSLMAVSAASFAQGSGSTDPTPTITAQLGTYLPDVVAIVTATLLICYGKKVYQYLK